MGFGCPFTRVEFVRAENGLSEFSDIIGIKIDAHVADFYDIPLYALR